MQFFVWHQRKQRAAIVSNAFTNRTRELIVTPVSGAGFGIGRDVRRDNSARQSNERHLLTRAKIRLNHSRTQRGPIARWVTDQAAALFSRQIFPAREPFRRTGKLSRAIDLPCAWPDEWTP